jgi:putative glutamine amidotransferase
MVMSRPPLIGITTSVTTDANPERAYVNAAYLHAVQQAGGIPILLPPHLDPRARAALRRRLDGLVLTGGGDIAPARYAETADVTVSEVSEARDALELELVPASIADALPLLAICRGIQVLNVALGGTLYQDLPSELGFQHSQKEARHEPTHRVSVAGETTLAEALGRLELDVNSMHHQAIRRLGRTLRDVAWAPDGVIEGVEMPGARALVIGVQWHPEELVGRDPAARALFARLVEAASARDGRA